MQPFILLAFVPLVLGSDSRCTGQGGTCQTDSHHCGGVYQSGLCDGASNRRCCIDADAACTGQHGHCQTDSHSCSGHYVSGLCGGASNRRCCIAGSSGSHTGSHTSGHGTGCYGDVNRLHTTGNGPRGVSGSQSDVRVRMNELNKYKHCFDQAAKDNCIEASVIGAMASRESNVGASLTSAGLGDGGHGYGIMQCDLYTSGMDCRRCDPFSCCHIEMMVREKIIPDIKYMQSKFPSSPVEGQLQAAIAAYNTGRGRVHSTSYTSVDRYTTGHDYSNDVIARAQYLKNHYGWS